MIGEPFLNRISQLLRVALTDIYSFHLVISEAFFHFFPQFQILILVHLGDFTCLGAVPFVECLEFFAVSCLRLLELFLIRAAVHFLVEKHVLPLNLLQFLDLTELPQRNFAAFGEFLLLFEGLLHVRVTSLLSSTEALQQLAL